MVGTKHVSVSRAKVQRRPTNCNIPMFLNVIMALYVYICVALIGSDAIHDALTDGVPRKVWTDEGGLLSSNIHHHRAGRSAGVDHIGTNSARARHHVHVPVRSAHGARTMQALSEGATSSDVAVRAVYTGNVYEATFRYLGLSTLADLCSVCSDTFICLALSGFTLTALHIASLSDPGEIPPEYQAPEGHRHVRSTSGGGGAAADGATPNCNTMVSRAVAAAGMTHRWTRAANREPHWCTLCEHERPLRSHHCRQCGICVARFDHHCGWIDNCVGSRNHKCFVLFIAYISGAIVHYSAMLVRYFCEQTMRREMRMVDTLHLILIIFYSVIVFVCGIFAFVFLVSTVYQMLRDETTIEAEHAERHKVPGAARKGICQNVCSVMGPSPLMWLVPELRPLEIEGRVVEAVDAASRKTVAGGSGPTLV